MNADEPTRRRFLRFLLTSPLVVGFGSVRKALSQNATDVIGSVEEALNVMDFEAAARKVLSPAHFGYLASGVDDDATLRANREGFSRFNLRVRRLVDVRTVDTSVSLFGTSLDSPIVLGPVGGLRAFHPEGEIAVARAAKAQKHLQILSTLSSTRVEDVTAARGAPVWYQFYPTDQLPIGRALVRRADAAGCPVLVLTVSLQGGSNRETLLRARRSDSSDCSTCHQGDPLQISNVVRGKPMFGGLDVSGVTRLTPLEMTWDYIKQLRQIWPRRLVIKGVVTRQDAELAVQHGVDGLIVSNHGGRAEDSGRATIESLVEVVEGVKGRVPVLVDSGFRRGTDIFKALALGATAVCIGRPYSWGLAAFGQPGVEAVLDILRRELVTVMRQAGTPRVDAINGSYVVYRAFT